jgi:hypothetical protein
MKYYRASPDTFNLSLPVSDFFCAIKLVLWMDHAAPRLFISKTLGYRERTGQSLADSSLPRESGCWQALLQTEPDSLWRDVLT